MGTGWAGVVRLRHLTPLPSQPFWGLQWATLNRKELVDSLNYHINPFGWVFIYHGSHPVALEVESTREV